MKEVQVRRIKAVQKTQGEQRLQEFQGYKKRAEYMEYDEQKEHRCKEYNKAYVKYKEQVLYKKKKNKCK